MFRLPCPEHHDYDVLRGIVCECVIYLRLGHEESQTEAAEARFNDPDATRDLFLEPGKQSVGQSQESNTVRPGALTTRAGLHAEEVVQQRAHKVVVEESVRGEAGIREKKKTGKENIAHMVFAGRRHFFVLWFIYRCLPL